MSISLKDLLTSIMMIIKSHMVSIPHLQDSTENNLENMLKSFMRKSSKKFRKTNVKKKLNSLKKKMRRKPK